MSTYLNTFGNSSLGIALCGRCSKKFPVGELWSDPNAPGLMVCREDLDNYDPYRLSPRPEDKLTLPVMRPDTNIATRPSGVITQDGTQFVISEDGQSFIFLID